MDYFQRVGKEVQCEEVPLKKVAEQVGTPAYVYSKATLVRHCRRLKEAFKDYPLLPCFAVKANSNLSVLKEMAAEGFGADVVSVGELERALLAGISPDKIVFSGVGKTAQEIRRALEVGILSFNVESTAELSLIGEIAQEAGKQASVCLRVNPNVDAKTNPYIATGLYSTKFGIAEGDIPQFLEMVRSSKNALKLIGLSCHIGSQITELNPFREATARMVGLVKEIQSKGFDLQYLDMGGGLGIKYDEENPPDLSAYAETILEEIRETGLKLVIEPGRVVVGNVGVLLTKVLYVKKTPAKTFVIVDGAMNDLLRPSIYKSYHHIEPVALVEGKNAVVDVVGPICETGDFLGLDRELPPVKEGDLLFIRGCGAYAATMASNYNSRPRAPEILIDGKNLHTVKPRQTLQALWAGE